MILRLVELVDKNWMLLHMRVVTAHALSEKPVGKAGNISMGTTALQVPYIYTVVRIFGGLQPLL